jgi:hypothetical protein
MVAFHDKAPRPLYPEPGQPSPGRYLATAADALRRIRQPEPWWAEAACRGRGTDLFFPRGRAVPVVAAELCASCPVTEACAEAGQRAYDGVWAGVMVRTGRAALAGLARTTPESRRARSAESTRRWREHQAQANRINA